ncbi:hypothetical protein BXZ70DRAFT_436323 [Cristinia sonorae]|uniref:Uncharacterized protein n=1 Tax=Cristinia sonorae TaxID=1940300 RepID=A0A8K0XM90_9AGAR|nr:hypothetical protein BXZ70DRAFT_436323 [Cristinia sonorae]
MPPPSHFVPTAPWSGPFTHPAVPTGFPAWGGWSNSLEFPSQPSRSSEQGTPSSSTSNGVVPSSAITPPTSLSMLPNPSSTSASTSPLASPSSSQTTITPQPTDHLSGAIIAVIVLCSLSFVASILALIRLWVLRKRRAHERVTAFEGGPAAAGATLQGAAGADQGRPSSVVSEANASENSQADTANSDLPLYTSQTPRSPRTVILPDSLPPPYSPPGPRHVQNPSVVAPRVGRSEKRR